MLKALLPGDVILAGPLQETGPAARPSLRPGDRVRQSIDGLGEFSFTIADRPTTAP